MEINIMPIVIEIAVNYPHCCICIPHICNIVHHTDFKHQYIDNTPCTCKNTDALRVDTYMQEG